jgi:hypothetical protein
MLGRWIAFMPIPANMGGKLLHYQASLSARAFGRVKVTLLKGALPTLTRPLRSGAPLGVGTRGASRHHSLDLASGKSNTGLLKISQFGKTSSVQNAFKASQTFGMLLLILQTQPFEVF